MKWRIGKSGSTIVSDDPLPDAVSQTDELDLLYYGGHLVAESVFSTQAAKLIAAAPDMLEALQRMLNCAGTPFEVAAREYAYCVIQEATK